MMYRKRFGQSVKLLLGLVSTAISGSGSGVAQEHIFLSHHS
jgi:hypothetical protein